jgi:hypothetical protein
MNVPTAGQKRLAILADLGLLSKRNSAYENRTQRAIVWVATSSMIVIYQRHIFLGFGEVDCEFAEKLR